MSFSKIIFCILAFIFTLGISIISNASAHRTHHQYPTLSPIPTINPCQEVDSIPYPDKENPCVTPTLTPAPIVTPSPTPSSGNPGTLPTFPESTTNAPAVAVCNIPFKAPTTPMFTRVSPTSVSFSWGQSTDKIDSQDIEYGYKADALDFGVALPATSSSYTIDQLADNQIIFAKVCAFKQGCAACSEIVDP